MRFLRWEIEKPAFYYNFVCSVNRDVYVTDGAMFLSAVCKERLLLLGE